MLTFPPDFSFVIQIVSLFILWLGLKRLAFDPFVALLEAREARTVGARKEAQRLTAAAQESEAVYEQRVHEARQVAAADIDATRGATEAEERRLLDVARTEAGARLAELRETLAVQRDTARASLAGEARGLADRIVEQVIGRKAG
jgi:F0F1-type ATP synthase membrane subunit b/b'